MFDAHGDGVQDHRRQTGVGTALRTHLRWVPLVDEFLPNRLGRDAAN
jgi:hypothetical protein